jgi:MAC/Perforin domain-containing protein
MVMRALRTLLSSPLLVLLLSGCSGSSSSSPPPPPPVDPATKGMDVLGKGTDAFGAYAVEANVKGQVLDVGALNAAGLLVFNPDVQEYRYEETTGHSMSSYASQLSANVGLSGSYMYFSAELKTSFSNDTYRRDDYSYASIIERHWKHSLRVAPGVWASGTHLRPYLTPLARQAIDDTDAVHGHWSGAEVIAAYGTHVMNGIYVGARLDYHLAIQIMDEQYRSSLSAFVKAKYGSKFASAGLESDISKETYSAMNAYQQVGPVINAKGGAAQYAHPEDDAQYQLWKASLTDSPVFCGIIEGGLLGIWDLAGTQARRQELLSAFEAYAATQGAAFVPLVERITDVYLVNAGKGTSVTLPAGYELIRAANGDTAGGHLNMGIYNDTVEADHVYVAYTTEVTDAPVGVSGVHVASSDLAVNDVFFGGVPHDTLFGVGTPGCARNAGVDLNAGTCKHGWIDEYVDDCGLVGWIYYWHAGCDGGAGTPLFLHLEAETPVNQPIRCIVVGDEVAVDANRDKAVRAAHIYFGPEDVNRDTKVDALDASWVLDHVHWLTNRTNGGLVNLNLGTQSFRRYDWTSCWPSSGWDDAWIHGQNAAEDAQHVGVCLP